MDNEKTTKISFLQIERYLGGEMHDEEAQKFTLLLNKNPALKEETERLQKLKNPVSYEKIFQTLNLGEQKESSSPFESVINKIKSALEILTAKPAALGLCAAGFALLLFFILPDRTAIIPSETEGMYFEKGLGEVKLQINGEIQDKESQIGAVPGDTLKFVYRSGEPVYFQVWYQDDGGSFFAYVENAGRAVYNNGSSRWKETEQMVVLDSSWNTEKVFILYSDSEFNSSSARKLLGKDKISDSIKVRTYNLVNLTR